MTKSLMMANDAAPLSVRTSSQTQPTMTAESKTEDNTDTTVEPRLDMKKNEIKSLENILPVECQPFVKTDQKPNNGKRVLQFKDHMTFVQNLDDPTPPYDHTCFAMKARYNCFLAPKHCLPNSPEGQNNSNSSSLCYSAHDFKLVLQKWPPPNKENETLNPVVCDFRQVVQQQLGGPLGVASTLQQALQRKEDHQTIEQGSQTTQRVLDPVPSPLPTVDTKRDASPRPINVVLAGNSYLRQIWESFACQFSSLITNGFFQDGGPGISLAALEARQGRPIALHEIGDFVPFSGETLRMGMVCHGLTMVNKRFYHPNVTTMLPPLSPRCNDNIAMLELGHVLRIWYVFRPDLYGDWNTTFEHIGLHQSQIDHIFWNDKAADPMVLKQWESSTTTAATKVTRFELVRTLSELQAKQGPLYYFFGADNPGMDKIPDGHPCMPGIPDDEVALLLFALAFGLELDL
ncbi:hypothetical protein ACA910_019031 [Epithemia clementina (nom. ined.)]